MHPLHWVLIGLPRPLRVVGPESSFAASFLLDRFLPIEFQESLKFRRLRRTQKEMNCGNRLAFERLAVVAPRRSFVHHGGRLSQVLRL